MNLLVALLTLDDSLDDLCVVQSVVGLGLCDGVLNLSQKQQQQ
jgi:hypothetical protein